MWFAAGGAVRIAASLLALIAGLAASPAMSVLMKMAAIVEEFEACSDWEARYQHLIELGRALPALSADEQTDDAKVRGCSSSVWLHAELRDGLVHYRADSDALLVKGLVAILLRAYSGQKPADIVRTPPAFIEELGLEQHLSATRANGLGAMVTQIKAYALAFSRDD